jgi:8-oxo-dGTP diphosphatase
MARIVLVAAAALVDVDGRVLICKRPQGKRARGTVGVSRR